LRKQQTLKEIDVRIVNKKSKIKTILKEYEALESKTEGQGKLDDIKKIGSRNQELGDLKVKLAQELSDHQLNILYQREGLEEELWRALLESGQMDVEDDSSDVALDTLGSNTGGSRQSLEDRQGQMNEQSNPYPGVVCAVGQAPDTANDKIQTAMSLLGAAKEDFHAATMDFYHFDRMCEEQRQDFQAGVIPEWREMSRTQFDLEQLAQKIQLTREVIRAEEAYSEAGRYAVEVGFIRDDADQSCHFVDEPDDGFCSGDRYATHVEEKDAGFIEAWQERIASPSSKNSANGDGDIWEVDSVQFGEGCSTHADEWNKIRISRWEGLREMERVRMRTAGNAASADDLIDQYLPILDGREVQQRVGLQIPRAGLWNPSIAIVKELLVSGQAAVAKFSATWSSRRGGNTVFALESNV